MRAYRAAVVVIALAVAAPSGAAEPAALLKCQKSIHSRTTSFVKAVQTLLLNCAVKVESCQLTAEIDGTDETSCLASASNACGVYSTKITSYETSYRGKAVFGCVTLFPPDLDAYTAGLGFFHVSAGCGTATIADLVGCIFAQARCAAERSVFQLDPRAQDALATAGIAASHPCVAP
jgi:hypothetical protein